MSLLELNNISVIIGLSDGPSRPYYLTAWVYYFVRAQETIRSIATDSSKFSHNTNDTYISVYIVLYYGGTLSPYFKCGGLEPSLSPHISALAIAT